MIRQRPLIARLVALALAAVVAACGNQTTSPSPSPATSSAPSPSAPASPEPSPSPSSQTSPTPVPSQDLGALYSSIEDQVIAIRGLPAKQRLTPTILDEAQLSAWLTTQFHKDNPPASVAASELTLKALGLLPAGASLEQLELDLQTAQVAGEYDPPTRQLFVVSRSGSIGPVEEVTFAHEYDHALQDQNFGIKALGLNQAGQSDRSLARLSLVEGDATLLMALWAARNLTPAQIASLANVDPQSQATLDAMPQILRDTLLFPYTSGLTFVQGAFTKGGWAGVDAVYARPPDTTSQVLHPDLYASHAEPTTITLDGTRIASAMGTGWSVAETDTIGEFQARTWLAARGLAAAATANPDLPTPDAAAAGWDGDRYTTLRGPGGAWALYLVSAWTTADDASEFAAGATVATRGLAGAASVTRAGTTRIVVALASSSAALATLRAAAGP